VHLTGGFRYTSDERKNIGGTNNGWSDLTRRKCR
jgi:iron complex outermembrane receptor protein